MFGGGSGGGSGGFSFGNQPKTTANATAGFTLGQPQQSTPGQASTGFAFGGGTGAAPAGGLFGAAKPTPAATSTGGLNFSGLGGVQSAPATGFGAAVAPQPAATGFGLGTGTQATPQAAAPGLTSTFGAAAPATGSGFSLGAVPSTAVAPTAGFGGLGTGFGGTAAASATAPGLGGIAAPVATVSKGFNFSMAATTKAAPVATSGLLPASTVSLPALSATRPLVQTTSALNPTGLTTGAPAAAGLKLGSLGTTPASSVNPGLSLGGFGAKTQTTTATASTALGNLGTLGTSTAAVTTGIAPIIGGAMSTAGKLPTAAAAPVAKLPTINYRQLEEAINKWSLELEDQEQTFLQQATQVNAWDRLLIENGEKITKLNTAVERIKLDQQRLDHELDFILAQQKELEEMLEPLEKTVEQLPPISYQQHADLEREHTYQLAEDIDGQLKRMVQDLKEIIDHLNTTNMSQDASNPAHQVERILNAHLDSLLWVDQNSALLQRRVEEVSKQADQRRKAQERNFRLAYD